MGFFKKIFKGVKKVFKKIGKGIKKVMGKVGKFMGKLGIVGQIGLGLLLPGIGSMMGSMFGSLAGSLATSSIGILRGAGQVINAAVNIGTKVGNVFSSITEGVTKVVGDLVGATLNKIPGAGNLIKSATGGRLDITSKTFTKAWGTAQDAISNVASAGGDLFKMDTLTGANKYLTQSAIDAGDAALEGIDTSSSYSDAMLEDLPQTMQPGFTPQESVIEQGLNLSSVQATPEGTLAEAVDSFRTSQEVTTGVSTAAAQTTAKPSLLSQATTRAREALVGAPEQLVKTGVTSLATLPRDAALAAIQGPPEVTYDVRQAAIPDIGFAGIGQEYAQPSFDPVSYFDQNEVAIAANPYGFNARIYNDATYARNMQSYGFQIPMYGMG